MERNWRREAGGGGFGGLRENGAFAGAGGGRGRGRGRDRGRGRGRGRGGRDRRPKRGGEGRAAVAALLGVPTGREESRSGPRREPVGDSGDEIEDYLMNKLDRWPPSKFLYEMSGPSHSNWVHCLNLLLDLHDGRLLWERSILPKLVNPDVLNAVGEEGDQLNKVLLVLLRPKVIASMRDLIMGLDGSEDCINPLVLLYSRLLERFPPESWRQLPILELCSLPSVPETTRAQIDALSETLQTIRTRERERRQTRAAHEDGMVRPEEIRDLPIVPCAADLERPDTFLASLPSVRERYDSLQHLCATHFHLLREDCMHNLRNGLQLLQQDGVRPHTRQVRLVVKVYENCRVVSCEGGRRNLGWTVTFDMRQRRNREKWESSRDLMMGSLLLLIPDSAPKGTWSRHALVATVLRRDAKSLGHEEGPFLGIEIDPDSIDRFDVNSSYTMVESGTFFEPYRHVLDFLRQTEEVPFQDLLLGRPVEMRAPRYVLERGGVFDFSRVFGNFEEATGRKTHNVLDEWPEFDHNLDDSQLAAIQNALHSEIALIQGPPGTGKTHVGVLLAHLLLQNRPRGVPILVVAKTNHALDSLLEKIIKFEPEIVRVGGRSDSERLKDRNLNKLQARKNRNIGRIYFEMKEVEEDASRACVGMKTPYLTENLLREVEECCEWSARLIRSLQQRSEEINTVEEDEVDEEGFRRVRRRRRKTAVDIVDMWLGRRRPGDRARPVEEEPNEEEEDDREEAETEQRRREEGIGGRVAALGPDAVARMIELARLQREEVVFEGGGDEGGDLMREDDFERVADAWSLRPRDRRRLHDLWLEELRQRYTVVFEENRAIFDGCCRSIAEISEEETVQIFRKNAIVGMTTTAGSRLRDLIAKVGPKIVIVEEAAEILEAETLACFSPSVEQAILIGDHVQLRPSVETYRLQVDKRLDLSMFERLVNNGVRHQTLHTQHRMRPVIASLLRPTFYRELHDHESVEEYPPVHCMGQNLVFIDHDHPERGHDGAEDSTSHTNEYEADMIVRLARYLVRNGYRDRRVTILTMYLGQQALLRRKLRELEVSECRVSTVDNFQGEESDIILLSLVRSTKPGFTRIANRVCVALSRAKHGMYIFGHAALLEDASAKWREIFAKLREGNHVLRALPMQCVKHPETRTDVATPEDFLNVRDGGCHRRCGTRLDCGHVCEQQCHPDDHADYECDKPCAKDFECGHRCPKKCHEPCGLCKVPMEREMPRCGHTQRMPCSTKVEEWTCREPCEHVFPGCGHQCRKQCGKPCARECDFRVESTCPKGHSVTHRCSEPPVCGHECGELLPCGHPCPGKCHECADGAHQPCNKKCERTLPCGHQCDSEHPCGDPCPPCERQCLMRCEHSRCDHPCAEPCPTCVEPCRNRCPHGACSKFCGEECDREPCNEPCPKTLSCGHPCIGLCGEPCPKWCRVCNPTEFCSLDRVPLGETTEEDRYVMLRDCGHTFAVEMLDESMRHQDFTQGEDGEGRRMQLPSCPLCRCPILMSTRYKSVMQRCAARIREITESSSSVARRVMQLLDDRRSEEAEEFVRCILLRRPRWAVAHALLGHILGSRQRRSSYHFAGLSGYTYSSLPERPGSDAEASFRQASELLDQLPASQRRGWRQFIEAAQTAMASSSEDGARAVGMYGSHLASGHFGENAEAARTLAKAVGGIVREGERGYWYVCPNGHQYLIGECGGATERSVCPDCGEQVGGEGHQLLASNRRVDEAETPWERAHRENPIPDEEMLRRLRLDD